MKKILIALFVFILAFPVISYSQTPLSAPCCVGDEEPPSLMGDPGTPVPIDGGLSILLAAGAAYGIKKVRENQKRGNDNQSGQK